MSTSVSIKLGSCGEDPKVIIFNADYDIEMSLDPKDVQQLMYKLQDALNTLDKLKNKQGDW